MKAVKTGFVIYGKHSDIVEYMYRGHKYEVEYAKNWSYCCTSPSVQHKDRQAEIDRMIDDTSSQPKHEEPVNMDEIFQMMGWD